MYLSIVVHSLFVVYKHLPFAEIYTHQNYTFIYISFGWCCYYYCYCCCWWWISLFNGNDFVLSLLSIHFIGAIRFVFLFSPVVTSLVSLVYRTSMPSMPSIGIIKMWMMWNLLNFILPQQNNVSIFQCSPFTNAECWILAHQRVLTSIFPETKHLCRLHTSIYIWLYIRRLMYNV